jgi:nucleoside-diphosphate-sugar epimerase
MRKIAITGAKGAIGSVLVRGLTDYSVTPIDLPEFDARDLGKLTEALRGHDAVIHLAHNVSGENFRNHRVHPDNFIMNYNLYAAAAAAGVRRVIIASSVHADNFYEWRGPGLLPADRMPPRPDSPYGAHKIFVEALGRHYAEHDKLEVVCIRLGGVSPENAPPRDDVWEQRVWLSHRDLLDLIRKCLDIKEIPDKFLVLYGVSNNTGKVHDISNPLGWVPQDDMVPRA